VPLLKDNELIGVLGMSREQVQPFTDRQIGLVRPRPRISESAFIGGFMWWDSPTGMMLVAYRCD
jgi:hypothetical protein